MVLFNSDVPGFRHDASGLLRVPLAVHEARGYADPPRSTRPLRRRSRNLAFFRVWHTEDLQNTQQEPLDEITTIKTSHEGRSQP